MLEILSGITKVWIERALKRGGMIAITALTFVLMAGPTPAQAQFVCGGSADGSEPQSGGFSTATTLSAACGGDAHATNSSVAVGINTFANAPRRSSGRCGGVRKIHVCDW